MKKFENMTRRCDCVVSIESSRFKFLFNENYINNENIIRGDRGQ